MKINLNGITFNYYGDDMLWIWPWKRVGNYQYYSYLFDSEYTDIADYWQHVGAYNEAARKEKIFGWTEDEMFAMWAKQTFRHSTVVVLRHVNVEMRNTAFWKSIDGLKRRHLLKDYPVFFFHNHKQAKIVAESIDPEFAEVFLFHRGKLLYSNVEKYEIESKQEGSESYLNFLGP